MRTKHRLPRCIALASAIYLHCVAAFTEERQSLEDAWWTGPIVAAGAGTLPQGHALVEPYVFDVISDGRFDRDGDRKSAPRDNSYGSLTYMLYGITDSFTAGLIPTFGYNELAGGANSAGIALGDISVQAQYRLAQFREGSRWPTVSIVLQESFPTGRFDKLERLADGLGKGTYATTLGLYTQYYFWLTGRILRARLNVSHTWPQNADVRDVSVYGTEIGFAGTVDPGNSLMTTLSGEYSITRNWVFALDLIYQHDDATSVRGISDAQSAEPIAMTVHSSAGWKFGVAPAIEYNWTSRVGVIAGVRWYAAGRNASASVTPVAALNMVF